MGESHDHQKRLIRDRIQKARARLEATDVARLSAAACERVLALPAFAAARCVVLYSAIGNELDPSRIEERARAANKMLYYPDPRRDRSGFVVGGGTADPLPTGDAVLVLVPGVAFDLQGVRLGRGDGWYDRALAGHPGALRVGLAYEFQMMRRLPEEPWDVRMHAVVTEARLVGEPSPTTGSMKGGRS
jgi:5-formyltetrahydrofolate cyclo-ligase